MRSASTMMQTRLKWNTKDKRGGSFPEEETSKPIQRYDNGCLIRKHECGIMWESEVTCHKQDPTERTAHTHTNTNRNTNTSTPTHTDTETRTGVHEQVCNNNTCYHSNNDSSNKDYDNAQLVNTCKYACSYNHIQRITAHTHCGIHTHIL